MGQLVGDDVGDVLEFGLRRLLRVDQQQRLAVGDAAGVLHRALREVGQRDHVDLAIGIRQTVVVGEEPHGEDGGIQRELRQMALARNVDDPDRHAVGIDGVAALEPAHHERHQVGGHAHGLGESDTDPVIAQILALHLGTVGDGGEPVGDDQGDGEHGLEVGFVPAWEGAPGIGRLELRGGDRVDVAVVVGVGGTVEAVELIVELAAERQVQRPGAWIGGIGKAERGTLQLLVEGDAAHFDPGSGGVGEPPVVDLEVQGVDDDLVDALVDLDGHGFGSREGGGLQIGFDREVVARGDHASRETVAVLHRSGSLPREPAMRLEGTFERGSGHRGQIGGRPGAPRGMPHGSRPR